MANFNRTLLGGYHSVIIVDDCKSWVIMVNYHWLMVFSLLIMIEPVVMMNDDV